jgi:osmotically inducible protein OsmC
MKRNATAVWNGSLKEGAGKLTTQSKTLENTQYSFKSRLRKEVQTLN